MVKVKPPKLHRIDRIGQQQRQHCHGDDQQNCHQTGATPPGECESGEQNEHGVQRPSEPTDFHRPYTPGESGAERKKNPGDQPECDQAEERRAELYPHDATRGDRQAGQPTDRPLLLFIADRQRPDTRREQPWHRQRDHPRPDDQRLGERAVIGEPAEQQKQQPHNRQQGDQRQQLPQLLPPQSAECQTIIHE